MQDYMFDQLAKDRASSLAADAAAARRVQRVRRERRARHTEANAVAPKATGAAHLVAHPVAVFHSWLAAGQL